VNDAVRDDEGDDDDDKDDDDARSINLGVRVYI
jgi:hypothetical protein